MTGIYPSAAALHEERNGSLRPQTPSELTQCVGCHSGNGPQDEIACSDFTSGTGNTIDSTWALARQIPGELGWREMDYMGYVLVAGAAPNETAGHASHGDPLNRGEGKGEFRHFLDNLVGVSLYGVMPDSVERFLRRHIRKQHGYTADWPELDTRSAEAFPVAQRHRQTLLRALIARADYLDLNGNVAGVFLYPSLRESLDAARRYRQVVVTQSYDYGKDVFPETPVTYRYFRIAGTAFAHQDGKPYRVGDAIVDRPVDDDPVSVAYGVGTERTLIDEAVPFEEGGTANSDYLPLLSFPESY